jgi:GR25 family glycosyltransferase involved in LPS biosynthesis
MPFTVPTETEKSLRLVYAQMPAIKAGASTPGNDWRLLEIQQESTVFFDRVYYINLERRTDRRKHVDEQLMKFKLGAARVVAQDGNLLEWHQNLGLASKYWNKGALGYCLSYQNAIADALQNGFQRILVMDDDAVLTDNFLEILQKAYETLPDDWHMLYLAANHNKDSMPTDAERVGPHLFRMKGSVGSHAIIFNRPSFETILNFASSPYGPLDVFFSVYQQICPCYITYPGLATQMPGRSDIIDQTVDYMKDWGLDYINHIAYLREPVAVKNEDGSSK